MAEDTLFSGESKNVEYKVTVPDKSEKYMKTVVAFANGRGGRIVFGIDDKTLEIVGMDVDNIYKTMDAITNAISDSCEPAIRPDVLARRGHRLFRLPHALPLLPRHHRGPVPGALHGAAHHGGPLGSDHP